MQTLLLSELECVTIRDFHKLLLPECTTSYCYNLAESIVKLFETMPPMADRTKQPSISVSFTPAQSLSVTTLLKIMINILHNQPSLDADEIYILNASKRIVNLFNATSAPKIKSRQPIYSSLLWWRR